MDFLKAFAFVVDRPGCSTTLDLGDMRPSERGGSEQWPWREPPAERYASIKCYRLVSARFSWEDFVFSNVIKSLGLC